MGAEALGLGISHIQDFSTARGAAGALFNIIDKVTMASLQIAASDFVLETKSFKV